MVVSGYASLNMMPLDEFRKLLGPGFDHLSEAEVKAIRDSEDRLAGVLFELWLDARQKFARPSRP